MDRETIIRLAREAEGHAYTNRFQKDEPAFAFSIERLERFAALVLQASAAAAPAAWAVVNAKDQVINVHEDQGVLAPIAECDRQYPEDAPHRAEPLWLGPAPRWPQTPADVRAFIGPHFSALNWANPPDETPHEDDHYMLSAHDLLSAFRDWEECGQALAGATAAQPSPAELLCLCGATWTHEQPRGWQLEHLPGENHLGPRWRHVRTGGTYTEVMRGTLQASDDLDMASAVIYRSEVDGRVWVRPAAEFEDGRFERIDRLDTGNPG